MQTYSPISLGISRSIVYDEVLYKSHTCRHSAKRLTKNSTDLFTSDIVTIILSDNLKWHILDTIDSIIWCWHAKSLVRLIYFMTV